MEGVPKAFMDLRDVVLELVEELESRTTGAAIKVYETELARHALDKMIELIIDAAMEISRRYAHSKLGVCMPFSVTKEKEKLKDGRRSLSRDILRKRGSSATATR